MKARKNIPHILASLTMIFFLFSACSRSNEAKMEEELKHMQTLMEDTRQDIKEDTRQRWEDIEAEFNEAQQKLDEGMSEMNDEMLDKYAKLKQEFNELRREYKDATSEILSDPQEVRISDRDWHTPMYIKLLFEPLMISEGDLTLNEVDANNITQVYANFVGVVNDHATKYSREDWDEVDILWDALNKRKNQVEGFLTMADKNEIGKYKTEYGALKATNKPVAKIKEKTAH